MSWIERDIKGRDALKNYDVFNILDFRDKEEVTQCYFLEALLSSIMDSISMLLRYRNLVDVNINTSMPM